MIAVFDAMATQGGNARSMAAGVSMATIPTMSGMIASLSGLAGFFGFIRAIVLFGGLFVAVTAVVPTYLQH